MITATVSDQQMQDAFSKHIEKIFSDGNYSNPAKEEAEKLFSYNGPLRDAVKAKVKELADEFVASDKFKDMLGQALVNKLAEDQLKEMKKNSKY